MIPEITQQNLHVLLPSKIRQTLRVVVDSRHTDPIDTLMDFYTSNTYRMLECEETKYWHFGPVALSQLYVEDK